MPGSAFFRLRGEPLDAFGSGLARAGNFDAGPSGVEEFVVGSEGAAVGATIYSGFDSSLFDGVGVDGSVLARVTFATGNPGDAAGRVVLGGFDFDGDGIGDVAIAAQDAFGGAGRVYVVYGRDAPLDDAQDGAQVEALDLDDLGARVTEIAIDGTIGLGAALAAADIDGDGADELFIGEPQGSLDGFAEQGVVHVIAGDASNAGAGTLTTASAQLAGLDDRDALGAALASGDVNGDGVADIVIGAPGVDGAGIDRGAAYVVFGASGGTPLDGLDLAALDASAGLVIEGEANSDALGRILSTTNDLDIPLTGAVGPADGIADLLISVPGQDGAGQNAGAVLLLRGRDGLTGPLDVAFDAPPDGGAWLPGTAEIALSGAVRGLGDVTGDRLEDFAVVGRVTEATTLGAVALSAGSQVVYLQTAGTHADYVIVNLASGVDGADASVAGLGDVNNDGVGDLGIGVPALAEGAGAVLGLLGGADNLAALDAADGAVDGVIDGGLLLDDAAPPVAFVPSAASRTVTGDLAATLDLRDGATAAEGTFLVADGDGPIIAFDPDSPDSPRAEGQFGAVSLPVPAVIGDGERRWVYELNPAALTSLALLRLGDGETLTDEVILTDVSGAQLGVAVEIVGRDDPAVPLVGGTAARVEIDKDVAQIVTSISASDPDQNDSPVLGATFLVGTLGTLGISEDGTELTYTLLPATIAPAQALAEGESLTETFTVDAGGIALEIPVEIAGRADQDPDDPGAVPRVLGPDDTVTRLGGGDDLVQLDSVAGMVGVTVDTGAGDDRVRDGAGHDRIFAPFGNNEVDTSGGNDEVRLLTGDNRITDSGTDPGETNWLRGGIGSDTITGGAGDDIIDGDSVDPFMGGSDRLEGGRGDDVLRGGAGADTFVFNPGDGADVIADFGNVVGTPETGYQAGSFSRDYTPGWDVIELSGFATLATAQDALGAVGTNADGWAEFAAEGTRFVLFGVDESELGVDDFLLI